LFTAGNFVINPAAQAPLYVTGPDSVGYGSAVAITTSGGTGSGALNFNTSTPAACSVNLTTGVITPNVSSGTCAVTATKLADPNHTAITSASFNVLLTLGIPTLSITNSPSGYTGSPIDANVVAKNGAGATVAGTTDNVAYDGVTDPPTDPGTYAVTADFAPSSANYVPLSAAPAGDFVIAGLAQTIHFTTTVPVGAGYGDTYTPQAVSNSGLDVTITVDDTTTDICEMASSGEVTFNNLGTCILDANQEGNDLYAAAPQVQQSIIVGRMSLVVTAKADDKEYDGTTAATVTLSDNHLTGDEVTVNYTSANFSDPAVGDNKTVTVSGLSLAGADAG